MSKWFSEEQTILAFVETLFFFMVGEGSRRCYQISHSHLYEHSCKAVLA